VIKVAALKPYVEPHHDHTEYHDPVQHEGPTSYHTSIHNDETYHQEPEPHYHPEPFYQQPESFHHSTPFSSQVHKLDVFYDDQPKVFAISPDAVPQISYVSKSDNYGHKNIDNFGERNHVERDHSLRVPRFGHLGRAEKKKAVTFHDPIKVPAPDILPFLEVTGHYEEGLDTREDDDDGFLHDFSQPSFHSFKLQAPRSGRSREEEAGFLELAENHPSSSLLRSKLSVEEAGAETSDLRNQEDADSVPIMRHLDPAAEENQSSLVKSWSSARYHGA